MLQMFSNGIWKPMPHDNFLINVANRAQQPIRPIEAQLHKGAVVKVGQFTFREKKDGKGNTSAGNRQETHRTPKPARNR